MRKGSLQLSINAIVILIMAIAMLGVGIFFINNVLSSTLSDTVTLSDDVKAQISADLKKTNSKLFLSGLSDSTLKLSQSKKKDLTVAVNNQLEENLEYFVQLSSSLEQKNDGTPFEGQDNLGVSAFGAYQETQQVSGATITSTVPIGEIAFTPISFSASTTRGQGLYQLTIWARPSGSNNNADYAIYGQQSFFVEVR